MTNYGAIKKLLSAHTYHYTISRKNSKVTISCMIRGQEFTEVVFNYGHLKSYVNALRKIAGKVMLNVEDVTVLQYDVDGYIASLVFETYKGRLYTEAEPKPKEKEEKEEEQHADYDSIWKAIRSMSR